MITPSEVFDFYPDPPFELPGARPAAGLAQAYGKRVPITGAERRHTDGLARPERFVAAVADLQGNVFRRALRQVEPLWVAGLRIAGHAEPPLGEQGLRVAAPVYLEVESQTYLVAFITTLALPGKANVRANEAAHARRVRIIPFMADPG